MGSTPHDGEAARGFRIGKLFHLTPLVDSLADAEFFFNTVFAPVCMMRNYSSHWHRHAAIYVIADLSIEPMQPLAFEDGRPDTSWYRYMDRYGPHIHNMAFYVDDPSALAEHLERAGVRTTDGGAPGGTVFAHPKDTPGMLEFSESGGRFPWERMDPRFAPTWKAFRDDYWPNRHPLGLERLSHLTVVVHDVADAARFYTDVLGARALDGQESTVPEADAAFVLVGEDTVLELVHPRDPESVAGRELASVGQCVVAVTFRVRDLARAEEFLRQRELPVVGMSDHMVSLDRARTWNTDYRFTDRSLAGDPR
ncbi:MAG TPA: VOC family protein [Acidimicrobiia bacterium]|nr:VOC family protein [Acidimicrobiia bacterium]